MSAPAQPPSIRTDWLADVAWRVAAFGLHELRTLDAEHFVIEDVLGGERWEIVGAHWHETTEAVVTFDADLRQPGEVGPPALRLGITLTAHYDDAEGRVVQVRLEVGPRGPVTFDPENWVFRLPLASLTAEQRPKVPGLIAGALEPRLPGQIDPPTLGKPGDLQGVGAVWLGDLVEIAEGRRTWTTVIGVADAVHRARRFGVGRPKLAEPFATLAVIAEGELRVAPLEALAGDSFSEVQPATAIDIQRDRVVIELPDSAVPGGQLTISGAGLTVDIHRVPA